METAAAVQAAKAAATAAKEKCGADALDRARECLARGERWNAWNLFQRAAEYGNETVRTEANRVRVELARSADGKPQQPKPGVLWSSRK